MSNKGLEHLCIQMLRVPSLSTKQKPLTCEDDKCLIYTTAETAGHQEMWGDNYECHQTGRPQCDPGRLCDPVEPHPCAPTAKPP